MKAGTGRKTGRDDRGEGGEEHLAGRTSGINRGKPGRARGKQPENSVVPASVPGFPHEEASPPGVKKLGENGENEFLPVFIPSIPVQ